MSYFLKDLKEKCFEMDFFAFSALPKTLWCHYTD